MQVVLREKIIAILGFFLLLYCIISFWLFGAKNEKYVIAKPNFGANGLRNSGQDFYVRQHGQYWVLYNYIKAEKEFTGNESVTLVLHGDWKDTFDIGEIFERWEGPISLTLFAYGKDFDRAINAIIYLTKCSIHSTYMKDFVSVNFIMHKDFLPYYIPRARLEYYFSNANCMDLSNFLGIDGMQHNLTFPRNLARNVGRTTARTHFVLLLDIDIIPSAGIPELFLEMIEANANNVYQPKTTVYVLPSFDIKFSDSIPQNEFEISYLDQEFLQLYLNSTSLHKIPRLREWLAATDKLETGIFDITRRWGQWSAYYISANDVEPFYDTNYDSEIQIERSGHLDLLTALDYNFYTVNFGFVVRRLLPPFNFYTEIPLKNNTAARVKHLRKINILSNFYKYFI